MQPEEEVKSDQAGPLLEALHPGSDLHMHSGTSRVTSLVHQETALLAMKVLGQTLVSLSGYIHEEIFKI